MTDEVLRVKDVCVMLQISRTTLYGLIKTGQIKASYVNSKTLVRKHPRFMLSDIQAYMLANAAKKDKTAS